MKIAYSQPLMHSNKFQPQEIKCLTRRITRWKEKVFRQINYLNEVEKEHANTKRYLVWALVPLLAMIEILLAFIISTLFLEVPDLRLLLIFYLGLCVALLKANYKLALKVIDFVMND